MPKDLALLMIHGMGKTECGYSEDFQARIRQYLGADRDRVSFQEIYYQDILQGPQVRYYEAVRNRLDYKKIREFLIFGFSDAGSLEFSRKVNSGAYEKTQERIFLALEFAFDEAGGRQIPVVAVAQSLGGHVFSNYVWDARKGEKPTFGLWRHDFPNVSDEERKFCQLDQLQVLVTTGCNIPIFLAGLPEDERKPFAAPNPGGFVWENYYDEDDVLGWPLGALNPDYAQLVTDIEVRVGGPITGATPWAHTQYWQDNDVIRPIARHIIRLLRP